MKVLDAPALADDFYLNLTDWSARNCVAVGLDKLVYTWDASTASVSKLTNVGDAGDGGHVTAVSWSQSGRLVLVGTSTGRCELWDAEAEALLRCYEDHSGRVACAGWSATTLATGSKDRTVRLRDVRAKGSTFQTLAAHTQEVCGLKWAPDSRLLATGSNDNTLCIWDACSLARPGTSGVHTSRSTPLHCLRAHKAAVKALAWSPHQQGLLASGGGTADKTIRLWNTLTGKQLREVQTASQVCALAWSSTVDELVSTHGFSRNEIIVWRHPDMTKVATLTGHQFRVLYLALSPDGQTAVTGAGDETLRFWRLFPPHPGATAGGKLAAGAVAFVSPPPSAIASPALTGRSAPGTPQRSLAGMR